MDIVKSTGDALKDLALIKNGQSVVVYTDKDQMILVRDDSEVTEENPKIAFWWIAAKDTECVYSFTEKGEEDYFTFEGVEYAANATEIDNSTPVDQSKLVANFNGANGLPYVYESYESLWAKYHTGNFS